MNSSATEEVRFTVVMPPDLYVALKAEAARQRKPAKDLVTTCLRACLEKTPPPPATPETV